MENNIETGTPSTASKNNTVKVGGIILGIVILIAALIAYFPDIPIPLSGGLVFRFIEPVRRQYARLFLAFLSWVFVQGLLIWFYIWIIKSFMNSTTKIKGLVDKIIKKIETISK